ncbi:hypothetical protein Jiend_28870 [Micromonospora endophytica]|nr:hypothetical protein Jiend_28870 [Micromonospora endophytica]
MVGGQRGDRVGPEVRRTGVQEAAAGFLDDQHFFLGPVGASGGALHALGDQGQQDCGGEGEGGDQPAGR